MIVLAVISELCNGMEALQMTKKCPVTGKLIPRRYAVHRDVLAESVKNGSVINNPNAGTLRRMVYRYGNRAAK